MPDMPYIFTRRHPAYAELEQHWRFLMDTFEGGPGWIDDNIFQYIKEGEEEYAQRKKRAYRDNISRDVIEIYTSHLFKVQAKREENVPPAIAEFWARSTRGRDAKGIDDFMREVADKTSACSPEYIVVDVPALPPIESDEPITQAMLDAAGVKPYVYLIPPYDMLDFGLDEDEEFTWCLVREWKRDDSDPFNASGQLNERFRLWTRTEWSLFEKAEPTESHQSTDGIRMLASGVHNLGRVPVVQVSHKRGKDRYRGISLIEEIAYKDRAVAQNESRLDVILADQTFSQLFIPDAGLITQTERTAEGKKQAMIKMGTNRIVLFHDKANHPPMFLSPDASQAALLIEVIDRLREQIYEDALLESEKGVRRAGGGPQTATEAQQDFEKLNASLSEKGKVLEAAEREVLELVCLWTGTPYTQEEVASWVTYPRKFHVKALVDELAEVLQVQQIPQLGAQFWERYLGRLIEKLIPDLTQEDAKALLAEVRENGDLQTLLTFGQQTEAAMAGGGDDEQEE